MHKRYFEPFAVRKLVYADGTFHGQTEYKFEDGGCTIMGVFVQKQSKPNTNASGEDFTSHGSLAVHMACAGEIVPGDTVRRVRDGANFRITGHPVISPEHAMTKIAVFECVIVLNR